jgi:oligopeptide transport system ATP-binding protein
MKIDTLLEPPMFQLSETHYAKTWLADPKAPKVEKPDGIQNIHEKLISAFNI